MIRRLIAPLAMAVVTLCAGQSFAQGAFPAPLPGQAGTANASPFPPVNGAAPAVAAAPPASAFPPVGGGAPPFGTSPFAAPPTQTGAVDECMKQFLPLREEAEKRGKLIGNFAQAEVKMLKYVETNAVRCGIPPQISEQLKRGHQGTETLQKKVCAAAAQMQKGPSGPTLSDLLGSSTALPEATAAKKGGAFDTLNGNALQR